AADAGIVRRGGDAVRGLCEEVRPVLAERAVPAAGDFETGQREAVPGQGVAVRGRGDMKQLLNTLYVTTQGAYLARDGEAVAVRVEQETKLRVPIHTLSSIVCFGQVSCSPFLMGLCGEGGVALSFLTEHGRFLARVQGPVSGNV